MLHWVDLAILVIIGLSVITGLFRGFIKELIALCIWILAIWLACNYSSFLIPWLQKYIQDKTVQTVAAFIAVMIATLIAGGIINTCIGFVIKFSGLSGMDRILGMGFGFVRGIFIIALIMLVINVTSLPHEQYERESQLYAKFDPVVNWLYGVTPDFIKQGKLFDTQSPNISKPIKAAVNEMNIASDFELSES